MKDQQIKRNVLHGLMILLGVIAIIPVYLLLINATRTTEQINLGISLFPGGGAFWSTTDEYSTPKKTDKTGTVKFADIIQGVTYQYEDDKIHILYDLPEGTNPRILILDDEELLIETYPVPGGAFIEVSDGDRIRIGHIIYKTFSLAAGYSGIISFEDIILNQESGNTAIEEIDKKTGNSVIRVNEFLSVLHDINVKPGIAILDDEGKKLVTYNLPGGSFIEVRDGERIQAGRILVKNLKKPPNVTNNWRALTGRGFQIWQGFGNSAFISICATILSIYFSGMTAYGLHIYRFKGRTIIWSMILLIMMLPGTLTFIGFYQLMARIKLTDSFLPLILPGIAASTTVLFIRQYMMSVLSLELIDAARIDGAGEYRIFNTIIIPVIIPALAAQSIFTFVGSWNNFITPFVLISTKSKYTLPMLIQTLRGDIYRTEFGAIYLGIAVSLIPIIVFYSFMSRFIISGLTMGGIKE
jgi:multiple sugar transport system permease protein